MLGIFLLVAILVIVVFYIARWIIAFAQGRRAGQQHQREQQQGRGQQGQASSQPQGQQQQQQQHQFGPGENLKGLDPSLIELLPKRVIGAEDAPTSTPCQEPRAAPELPASPPGESLLTRSCQESPCAGAQAGQAVKGVRTGEPKYCEESPAPNEDGHLRIDIPSAGGTAGPVSGPSVVESAAQEGSLEAAPERPRDSWVVPLPQGPPPQTGDGAGAEGAAEHKPLSMNTALEPQLPPSFGAAAVNEAYVLPTAAAKECAVCLGEYRNGDIVKWLPHCGHTFHAVCIDAWLRSNCTCPLCRLQVGPSVQEKQSAQAG